MNAGADTISLDKSTIESNRKKYKILSDYCHNRESMMRDPRPAWGCHHQWGAVK